MSGLALFIPVATRANQGKNNNQAVKAYQAKKYDIKKTDHLSPLRANDTHARYIVNSLTSALALSGSIEGGCSAACAESAAEEGHAEN